MELATYIVRQMEGVRSILGSLIEDVTPAEWVTEPADGQNAIGFTAWHVPSIQDWAIHTWMQNVEPVRARPEWRERGMMASFLPVGMGLQGARDVAAATKGSDVLAYADAVLDEARLFLGRLTAEFDGIPANRGHLVDDRFKVEGYLAEVGDMYEQPVWQLFAGACTGHCRGHLGELELGLGILRAW